MHPPPQARTGGQIFVDALKIHGVDLGFCVPGESYLAVLDALYGARDSIRLITCRHEGGRHPVVCFAGDGCFLMTAQELATAVQYRLPIIFLVINNGMYGTIRMHQE